MEDAQTIIAKVGATIASTLTIEEAMSTIARQVGEAFDVASADIHRYSAETDVLDYVASWGMANGFVEEEAGVGASYPPDIRPSFVQVVRERRIVECHRDDPDVPPAEAAEMDLWGEKSTLDAPLEFGGYVIGVLGIVETRSCRRFTEAEKRLFSQLAVLAAIAIHNADVFTVLEQQNRSLKSLLEASRVLASTVGIDDTLKAMSRSAAEALGSPGCVIYELADGGDALVPRWSHGVYGDGDGAEAETTPQDRPALGSAQRHREIVVMNASDASVPDEVRRSMNAAGELTHLHVPLVFNGRPLGLLVLVETARERVFTAYELELARGLGEHAAVALHNAGLYQAMHVEATTDGLTGLYNFRYLQSRLREETARFRRYGSHVSLLILDVDDFKRFNDDFGHPTGDVALKNLAAVVRDNVRTDIDIVCRYGGRSSRCCCPTRSSGGGAPRAGAVARRTKGLPAAPEAGGPPTSSTSAAKVPWPLPSGSAPLSRHAARAPALSPCREGSPSASAPPRSARRRRCPSSWSTLPTRPSIARSDSARTGWRAAPSSRVAAVS